MSEEENHFLLIECAGGSISNLLLMAILEIGEQTHRYQMFWGRRDERYCFDVLLLAEKQRFSSIMKNDCQSGLLWSPSQ